MKDRKKPDFKYKEILSEMKKNRDTQKSLANIIGMSSQELRSKLIGKYEWKKSEIDKLCIYYGRDYYELFKGD